MSAHIRSQNVDPSAWCAMDWTNGSILQFLQLYKSHPCIWNNKHSDHRVRDTVSAAWADIQKKMPLTCTIAQLKKKKESLMSSYRSYKTKIHHSKSVNGASVYQPSWFAFDIMDSFLSNIYLCNPTPWDKIYHTEWIANKKTNAKNESITDEVCESNPLEVEDQNAEKNNFRPSKRPRSPKTEHCAPKRQVMTFQPNNQNKYEPHGQTEEDECSIVTKLWANKLRKLPEDRRDVVIYKINSILYKEVINHNRAGSSSPCMIVPSPVQIFHEEDSELSESFDDGMIESPTDVMARLD